MLSGSQQLCVYFSDNLAVSIFTSERILEIWVMLTLLCKRNITSTLFHSLQCWYWSGECCKQNHGKNVGKQWGCFWECEESILDSWCPCKLDNLEPFNDSYICRVAYYFILSTPSPLVFGMIILSRKKGLGSHMLEIWMDHHCCIYHVVSLRVPLAL